MPERSLADRVRDRINTGLLPTDNPLRTWTGDGSGRLCDACDIPILAAQIEYELEMDDGVVYPLHIGCHGLWLIEMARHRWWPPTG